MEFKPYQLRPKKRRRRNAEIESFIESPIEEPPTTKPPDPRKLKGLLRKLDKLNKKIRRSRGLHRDLVNKRDSIRKEIEDLKQGISREPEWEFRELVQE